MSHPIDVGSVLGGRYKVTATVLTSHDQDLVLDGVDQVLNRPVSILVAGPGNGDQVAQSAREVATGERPGSVQILDLGVSEATTYLITNHTSAADLLDLVVAAHPPYVEPFFTDTLGSEIFGQARSHEPETYEGLYDEEEVDAGYINYQDVHPATSDRPTGQPPVPPRPPARPAFAPSARQGSGASAGGAGAAAGAAGAAAAAGAARGSKAPITAPQAITTTQSFTPEDATRETSSVDAAPLNTDSRNPGSGHGGNVGAAGNDHPAADVTAARESPKVSLWSEDDYGQSQDAGTQFADYGAEDSGHRHGYSSDGLGPASGAPFSQDYYDDDEPRPEPRSMRWLVGGLLAAVLVVGLVFAVGNLGSLFKSEPQTKTTAGAGNQSTGEPSPSASNAPVAAPPVIAGVTRLGSFDFAATYDGDLSKTFDGNAASYWSDMEFATENWGGYAPDGVPLVVKLKSPALVSSITLSQLGASGGSISVLTNDRPSLDGAKQVGTNSFTSPDLTIPLSEPVNTQYVIVYIKTLPKLAAPKTRFGYGLRLAEIKIQ